MWGYAKDITQLMRLVNEKGLLGSDDRGLLLYRLSKVLGEGEKTLVCNTIVEPETPAYTRGNFTVYLRWVEGRQLWRGYSETPGATVAGDERIIRKNKGKYCL